MTSIETMIKQVKQLFTITDFCLASIWLFTPTNVMCFFCVLFSNTLMVLTSRLWQETTFANQVYAFACLTKSKIYLDFKRLLSRSVHTIETVPVNLLFRQTKCVGFQCMIWQKVLVVQKLDLLYTRPLLFTPWCYFASCHVQRNKNTIGERAIYQM